MINFLPKSGFEVVHPSVDQLIVVAHVQYVWLLVPLLIFAVATKFIISGLRKTNSGPNPGVGIFMMAVAVVVLSGLISHGQAVFDKQAGTVSFDRTGFFFRTQHLRFPLEEVRYATVRPMGGGSYHFVVVFQGGETEDIVASSSASGQYKAAEAVNDFLGIKSQM